MLTSVHTLFQSLVRLLLAEEFFLMSTQIPTCWLCRETLLLSSTSLKGHRTQPRKYVVTEDSNICFEVGFGFSYVWRSGPTVQYEFELFGLNGQGSNPCKDAFLWHLPLLRAIGLKYEKAFWHLSILMLTQIFGLKKLFVKQIKILGPK